MDDRELNDIENRLADYPPQARHDILRLTQELRRLTPPRQSAVATSPLYDALTGAA